MNEPILILIGSSASGPGNYQLWDYEVKC